MFLFQGGGLISSITSSQPVLLQHFSSQRKNYVNFFNIEEKFKLEVKKIIDFNTLHELSIFGEERGGGLAATNDSKIEKNYEI